MVFSDFFFFLGSNNKLQNYISNQIGLGRYTNEDALFKAIIYKTLRIIFAKKNTYGC